MKDSGMTDSQFMKFQQSIKTRMEKDFSEMENCIAKTKLRQETKTSQGKKSFWQKIKEVFLNV